MLPILKQIRCAVFAYCFLPSAGVLAGVPADLQGLVILPPTDTVISDELLQHPYATGIVVRSRDRLIINFVHQK
jgi:hypothetical protein